MSAVKVGVSRQIVIPKRVYDQLRLSSGDYLEVELEGDRLILTPKELVDKRLAESLKDLKKGRVYGPFDTAKETIRALRGRRPAKSTK